MLTLVLEAARANVSNALEMAAFSLKQLFD